MNNINLRLDFVSNFCNNWPEIQIEINDQIYWQGFVVEKHSASFDFKSLDINKVTIRYLNKQNGPTQWDTKIDESGNIIEDQNCLLTDVYINRAKCSWLVSNLTWIYQHNNSVKNNYGFMDLKGHTTFEIPQDVYKWIIQQRQESYPQSDKPSAINYKNIYIPRHENELCLELIEQLKQKLKLLNV